MAESYHNPLMTMRASSLARIGRYVTRDDGTYERIITVAASTTEDTGHVLWSLGVVEVGPGRGFTDQLGAHYPGSGRADAARDAITVGRRLGLRARIATEQAGWEWLLSDAELAHDLGPPSAPSVTLGSHPIPGGPNREFLADLRSAPKPPSSEESNP